MCMHSHTFAFQTFNYFAKWHNFEDKKQRYTRQGAIIILKDARFITIKYLDLTDTLKAKVAIKKQRKEKKADGKQKVR